jgi:hypothetical protein
MPVPSGALRFNSDSGKLEYYNGEAWWQIDSFTPDSATGGARGVFGGGISFESNIIEYITISTTGNTIDFGDLTVSRRSLNSFSSSTRGVFAAGRSSTSPNFTNVVDYITISSTGNAINFGDTLTNALRAPFGLSNSIRGLFGGGYTPTPLSLMEYTTISSLSAFQDFGNLQTVRSYMSGCSSSTRGLISSCGPASERIDFVTISTLGNSSTFGNLTQSRIDAVAISNSTRGVFAGGGSPTYNIIDYVTISSTGNAQDFGDLLSAGQGLSGCESQIRGIYAGGNSVSPATNVIQYITITTTGNAVDFGDLSIGSYEGSAVSNGHGGL